MDFIAEKENVPDDAKKLADAARESLLHSNTVPK